MTHKFKIGQRVCRPRRGGPGDMGEAEVFEVLWQTTMQHRVPAELLARVSSYDLLGSFVAIPIGQLLAAPVSAALGVRPSLILAGAVGGAVLLLCLLVREVRAPA